MQSGIVQQVVSARPVSRPSPLFAVCFNKCVTSTFIITPVAIDLAASVTEPQSDPSHATLDAISVLFEPLARLALAHGVTVMDLQEAMRRALVRSARQTLLSQGLPEHRLVSRISASTGLTRREVMRIVESLSEPTVEAKGSPAAQVFTRWAGQARWPRVLKRSGAARSFDALARSVTQDVHPRTLLDELVRLRMVALSEDGESVERLKDAFVPGGDERQMLDYLAANVGSHLTGVVSNVVKAGPPHFDQAVFADELSAESIPHIQAFVTRQWQRLFAEAVPLLETRIESDRQAGRPQDRCIRIGLYTYEDTMPAPPAAPAAGQARAGGAARPMKAAKTAKTLKTAKSPARDPVKSKRGKKDV